MIEGVVNASYEAVVSLPLQSQSGQVREIEAVVDTGFNGFLTLPSALVGELALPFVTRGWATLADGSRVSFDTYAVAVVWEGQPREVLVDAADTTPLVGMQMLDDHDLSIQVRNGGRVLIQPAAP